jgi:beta-lactamase regulating signal transducer with metallopeptidase domain
MNWLEFTRAAAAMGFAGALNSLWIGVLLAALAAVALRAMPRPNATTRYAIWFTALLLILAMPALLLLIPRSAPVSAPVAQPVAHPGAIVALPVTAAWPLYIMLAWLGISLIMLARIAFSLWHIHVLKHDSTLIGMRDGIRLLASPRVRVPMAAGFMRRAVIFPQSLIGQLAPEEYEQVLCHELAHLRRGDDWTQLAQAIAQALLFFHPAVYWIGSNLKIERELACDDWVVGATGKARPYAACLTHLHELTRRAHAPRLAPGATVSSSSQITTRVEALLEPGRDWTPRFSGAGWLAACGLVGAGLVVAARIAPPVAVEDLPLAPMRLASLHAPRAPAIARTPARAAPIRHRVMAAKRQPPPDTATGTQVVLVRAWRLAPPPGYVIITVVFFEPPPPPVLSGI